MTQFRRKQSNGGTKKIMKLFGATAVILSALFMFSSVFVPSTSENASTSISTSIDPIKRVKPMKQSISSPESKDASNNPNYHIVFSTDCSKYQKWQTYLLFYSAMRVKQPGTVTRIASGCTPEEEESERAFHADIAKHMSTNFKIHLTPRFSGVKDENGEVTEKKYDYFNKPFGLLHWMEHSEENFTDDDIIILLDPDQALTRPITNDFSNLDENLLVGKNPKTIVTHGQPFAQKYGMGNGWMALDLTKVTLDENSPAHKVSRDEGRLHYPVGPPYLATAKDMHLIAKTWVDFVPRSHKEHPHLMAEMFAFCIAAAHLELPFQLVRSLMVSVASGGTGERSGEGWKLINAIDDDKVCTDAALDEYTLPSVLHYCQRYIVGKFFFGKRRIPMDIFSCDKPLLLVPPEDVAQQFDYYVPPSGTHGTTTKLNQKQAKQMAFMLCALTRLVNEASVFYQGKNCDKPKDESLAIDFWSLETVSVKI